LIRVARRDVRAQARRHSLSILLTEYRLALAPGEGFGPSGAGWARISLAVPDETLELGLERLAAALG